MNFLLSDLHNIHLAEWPSLQDFGIKTGFVLRRLTIGNIGIGRVLLFGYNKTQKIQAIPLHMWSTRNTILHKNDYNHNGKQQHEDSL